MLEHGRSLLEQVGSARGRAEGRQRSAGRRGQSRHAALGLHDPRRAPVSPGEARISRRAAAYQRGLQRRRERVAGRGPPRHRRALQPRPHDQSDRAVPSGRGSVPVLRAVNARRGGPQATLAAAIRLPLILPGRPHGLRILVDSVCAESGARAATSCWSSIRWRRSRRWCARVTPRRSCLSAACYREVAEGAIVARRIVSPSLTRTLVIGETVRRPKTPATTAIVQCLREEVKRLVEAAFGPGRIRIENAITDRPI